MIVFENEKCQILLCWGSNFKLKVNFPVKNIPFFALQAKNSEKMQFFWKYWHFWISVYETFSKSEIFCKKLILARRKCFKMVQKGLFFKFLGFSRNLRPPAEQKSAILIFKDNQSHNIWEKREIPQEVLKPQSICKCSKVGWKRRVLTLSSNARLQIYDLRIWGSKSSQMVL